MEIPSKTRKIRLVRNSEDWGDQVKVEKFPHEAQNLGKFHMGHLKAERHMVSSNGEELSPADQQKVLAWATWQIPGQPPAAAGGNFECKNADDMQAI